MRQHHKTCGPATLTTLARYWQQPADHLEIADRICYDGTPWHEQRHWAETNGWLAREFRVTWDSARALLDRGICFALTIAGPGYAHMQTVIGYDAVRGTLLIRDPTTPLLQEPLAARMIEALRSIGPRGMALVPLESATAAQLAALDLPDAELYDISHRLARALAGHTPADALANFEELQRLAPDHDLTLQARRALADYDEDHQGLLESTQRLQERYPEDSNLTLQVLASLRKLSRRDEWLQLLKSLSDRRIKSIASRQSAESDPESAPESVFEADPEADLSDSDLSDSDLSDSDLSDLDLSDLDLSDLDLSDLDLSDLDLFVAARYLRKTESAVQFLNVRFQRFGARSGRPVRTLCEALLRLSRIPAALSRLEEGLRRCPTEGALQLYAVSLFAQYGQRERAAALLETSRDHSAPADWLRASALFAERVGDTERALELWLALLQMDPLDIPAHRALVSLLARFEGPAAVQSHFETFAARFPHHCGLHQWWVVWMRDNPLEVAAEAREPVLRHLLEINPDDVWARCTLAGVLEEQNRLEEAFAEAELAIQMAPRYPFSHLALGDLYRRKGDLVTARACYRRALANAIDSSHVLGELMAACDTLEERREALRFVHGELQRQTVFGDALFGFRQFATETLAPEEIHAVLQEALDARPDLWQAWAVNVEQLIDLDRAPDAERLAQQATERFPLIPTLWKNLAQARLVQGDMAGAEAALQEVLAIFPDHLPAYHELALVYRRQGKWEADRVLTERVELPEAHPVVGELWAGECVRRQRFAAEKRLPALYARGEIGMRALHDWLQALTQTHRWQQIYRTRPFCRRHQDSLKAHDLTWGKAGYALYCSGNIKRTVEWTSDWRSMRR